MIDSVSSEGGQGNADLKKARRVRRVETPRTIDRLPPSDLTAEEAVLGCILLAPNETIPVCITKLRAGSETFYDLRCQSIYDELLEMFDARIAIDIVTLMARLKDKQILEQVGGYDYLSRLPDKAPSAAAVEFYLDIVAEKFLLRKMIHVCTDIVGRVYEHEGEVPELLDEVERDLMRIMKFAVTETSKKNTKELVKSSITKIEEMHQRQGAIMGIETGFKDFDRMTDGLQGGQMIVIAARPSLGKTSIAMNIAEFVAVSSRIPVGVFSLEMTAEQLMLRMLCSAARVNLRSVRDGFMAERDFPKLTSAAGRIAAAPLYIDDEGGLTIMQIRAKARRMAQEHGIKLFVIDYLQLARSDNKKSENRQQEIADISSGIKSLAKELNVPIIVLAQLNRDMEREKRTPRMSDLRESGSIEADADLVGLLYRPSAKDDESPLDNDGSELACPVNLLIAKSRNGPTGEIPLTFLKNITRFESAAKISDDNIPTD